MLSFFYFLFKLKNYKFNHFSCKNWTKGLNNSFIDNKSKAYPCNINIPQPNSCYISEVGSYFDFTKFYKPTCLTEKIMKYDRNRFLRDMKNLKYIKISKKNHFGYPLTNKEFLSDSYGSMVFPGNKNFENDINEKVILMDLYNKNNKKYYPKVDKPEIEIILTKNGGKIELKVKKNKTLIKEREEILKTNNNPPKYKNIILMFLDTLSRAHFHRKFIKTISFLEKFHKYEPNPFKKI